MPQGVLPFKYEEERNGTGMTAMAGLPAYLDLGQVMGVWDSIKRNLHVREVGQGWRDEQVVMSLILLNLAGGECVEDLGKLEGDGGFCRVLKRMELWRMKPKERRAVERRWRKQSRRSVPSASAVFRYLEVFHDREQEEFRQKGKAFIPSPNEHLKGLVRVNGELIGAIQRRTCQQMATLDMDGIMIETRKEEALYGYKGYKAYQPLNVWWAEQEVILHTEFRDGNVPAGHEQLRVLEEALEMLPEGVKKVRLRVDTAGYEHELLRYCEEGNSSRFGRIEFAIGCDVTPEFKKAALEVEESDWEPIWKQVKGELVKTEREWAEVCYVPNAIGHSKKGPVYRYLAIREPLRQLELLGIEAQGELSFATVKFAKQSYKIFGIVTNMDWGGQQLIPWHHKRCGKGEEAHAMMREDFAGSKFPSGDFGQNAAWWWIMIIALNLNSAMKQLVLGGSWVTKRMKAIRFGFINVAGRVLERSRQLIIRLTKGHPVLGILLEARQRILELAAQPSG